MNGVVVSIGMVLVFIYLGAGQVGAQPVPPSAGLVGWWRAETNALDSSTRTNHGTLQNGVAFDNGKFGKAFSFAGTANRVFIADSPDFWLSNSISVAAWIFPKVNSWQVMEREGSLPGNAAFAFGMNGAGNIKFGIHDIVTDVSAEILAPLPLNVWSHAAATLDGATGNMRLYLNGLLVAETNTTVRPPGQIMGMPGGIGIGNAGIGTGFPFVGLVDELVLYSRALSAEEIGSLLVEAPPTLSPELFFGANLSGLIGRTYTIQYATNVSGPNWSNLTSITLTQSPQLWIDTSVSAGASAKRFYRAVLVP